MEGEVPGPVLTLVVPVLGRIEGTIPLDRWEILRLRIAPEGGTGAPFESITGYTGREHGLGEYRCVNLLPGEYLVTPRIASVYAPGAPPILLPARRVKIVAGEVTRLDIER